MASYLVFCYILISPVAIVVYVHQMLSLSPREMKKNIFTVENQQDCGGGGDTIFEVGECIV